MEDPGGNETISCIVKYIAVTEEDDRNDARNDMMLTETSTQNTASGDAKTPSDQEAAGKGTNVTVPVEQREIQAGQVPVRNDTSDLESIHVIDGREVAATEEVRAPEVRNDHPELIRELVRNLVMSRHSAIGESETDRPVDGAVALDPNVTCHTGAVRKSNFLRKFGLGMARTPVQKDQDS